MSLSPCHAVFEVLPCPLRLLGHVLHWRFLIPIDSPFLYTEWSVAKGFHWCHAAVLLPSSVRTNRLLQFVPIHLVNVSVTQVDFVAHHKKMISRKHHMKGVVGAVDVVV